ncbi:MAG: hypothetical protein WDN31_08905 [Hyphomicrobium sp.]
MHTTGQEGTDDNERRFTARFESELRRLDESGQALTFWQEESLLGALGAARLGEYELACGMIREAERPPPASVDQRAFRRQPMPLATLRRRFERLC